MGGNGPPQAPIRRTPPGPERLRPERAMGMAGAEAVREAGSEAMGMAGAEAVREAGPEAMGNSPGGGRREIRAWTPGSGAEPRMPRSPARGGGVPHAAEPHIDAVGRTGPEVRRRKCPRARIPRGPRGSVVRPAVRRTVPRRRGRTSGRRGPGRSPAGCKGRSPLIREGVGQGTPPPEMLPSPHPRGPGRQCRASCGQAYRPEETRPYLRSAIRRTTGGRGEAPRGARGEAPWFGKGGKARSEAVLKAGPETPKSRTGSGTSPRPGDSSSVEAPYRDRPS